MTHELEEALKGALSAAARQAPLPEPDLLDRVNRRHRIRRRNRTALLAAATVVVLAGTGVVAATVGSGGNPVHPAVHPSTAPIAQAFTPVAVEQLWPQAVRTVPKKLPNGRRFRPLTLLDATTMLVSTESSFERADGLSTLDIATRETRSVTRIATPPSATTFASDFTTGEGQVAWWMAHRESGRTTVEVWAAALAGGGARRISEIDAGKGESVGLSRLVISSGQVVWSYSDPSPSGDAAIYRAPLTGGPEQKIPGTDGYQIVSWPWIGSPRPGTDGDPSRATFQTLRNAQTGEQRNATLSMKAGKWSCGVTWCLGSRQSDTTYQGPGGTMAQRRDGGAVTKLPDDALIGPAELPAYDRFTTYLGAPTKKKPASRGLMLHDLSTGQVADLGVRATEDGAMSSIPVDNPANRLYVVDRSNNYMLIDLASV